MYIFWTYMSPNVFKVCKCAPVHLKLKLPTTQVIYVILKYFNTFRQTKQQQSKQIPGSELDAVQELFELVEHLKYQNF